MDETIKIFNVSEAAEYLRAPKTTIYMLAETNKMPAFKVGRQWRFRKDAIDKWILKKEKCKTK
jgi:excisionase family DNA binding protein